MAEEKITKKEPSNKELLTEFLVAAGLNPEGLGFMMTIFKESRFEHTLQKVLDRMRPDEPPKTEKVTFGELNLGNEFLWGGVRYRFVKGGGIYAALALDGPSKNILHWPGAQAPVDKIVE